MFEIEKINSEKIFYLCLNYYLCYVSTRVLQPVIYKLRCRGLENRMGEVRLPVKKRRWRKRGGDGYFPWRFWKPVGLRIGREGYAAFGERNGIT